MKLLTRLAAVAVMTVSDARDAVIAEVARMRAREDGEPLAEPGHQHRYDPASTTACITEQADGSEPWSAGITPGDIPREPPYSFGFGRS
jgi:hypothetical protein